MIRQLGPKSFFPPPRVHSAILQAVPDTLLPQGFTRFCRTIFSYRRKVIRRALRDAGWSADYAAAVGINDEQRVQELSVEQLLALSNAVLEGETS